MSDFSGFFKNKNLKKKKGWDDQDKARQRSSWTGRSRQEEAARMVEENEEKRRKKEDDSWFEDGGIAKKDYFKKIKSLFKK